MSKTRKMPGRQRPADKIKRGERLPFVTLPDGAPVWHEALVRNLKRMRLKNRYTKCSLADRLGVSPYTYKEWEAGKKCMGIQDIEKLACIYDVEPYVFFLAPSRGDKVDSLLLSIMIKEKYDRDFLLTVLIEWLNGMRYSEHGFYRNSSQPLIVDS